MEQSSYDHKGKWRSCEEQENTQKKKDIKEEGDRETPPTKCKNAQQWDPKKGENLEETDPKHRFVDRVGWTLQRDS